MNFNSQFSAVAPRWCAIGSLLLLFCQPAWPAASVYLLDVPDYDWWRGCFGTGCGNLFAYWDRNGFPNFYTGPTGDGRAPLTTQAATLGIRSMWASKAGFDGRPADQPGHEDDYWRVFENADADPYLTAGRKEHAPDSIGDFIGLSQRKWTAMAGECDGNIDGYAFVYWDRTGERRRNFVPDATAGAPGVDLQSGLNAWSRYRGYQSEVFTQLVDFNPTVESGKGFTFEDLKAEIDAGYPVLLFLQRYNESARVVGGMQRANPAVHCMLAHGYHISTEGRQYVRYKTSWGGSGENTLSEWNSNVWQTDLPLRGVIGYRPLPKITSIERQGTVLTLNWHGPASRLYNTVERSTVMQHWYVVEKSAHADFRSFERVSEPMTEHAFSVPNCCDGSVFFRVKLVGAAD